VVLPASTTIVLVAMVVALAGSNNVTVWRPTDTGHGLRAEPSGDTPTFWPSMRTSTHGVRSGT
jgi:hypothetical protein